MIVQNGSLKCIGRPPSWIFESNFQVSVPVRAILYHLSLCHFSWISVILVQSYRDYFFS